MATEVIMPKFGLSMEEGSISEWLVKEGDAVTEGQPIAEINSEKLTNTALATANGVIARILADEGESLPCGSPIAIIAAEGESYEAGTPPAPILAAPSSDEVVVEAVSVDFVPLEKTSVQASKITPRAKKLAEAKGLSYEHIQGTGLHGFITIEDLMREGRALAAQPTEASPEPIVPVTAPPASTAVPPSFPTVAAPVYAPALEDEEVLAMDPMQRAICDSMYSSMTQAAQTTLMTEANVRNLVAVYWKLKPKYTAAGLKLSYTALLIKAVAMALENHPHVRMHMLDANHYTVIQNLDIGIAVDIPGGLVVPVVRGANLKDLRTICQDLSDITDRAKRRTLTEQDLGNGAITITNLGMFGVTYFTPILNAPEPCIIGVGGITEKAVVREGGIFSDPVMNLSVTHDHRITNGAPTARFLQEVVGNLNDFRWV